MRHWAVLILAAALTLLASLASADPGPRRSGHPAGGGACAAAARPRIGLVLGGGGAKGGAHIGVIKVLEEMHIPIDCIAGTSMGSIVGAAYATGQSAQELEKVVTSINWREVLSTVPRQDIPYHRKNLDAFFTNGLELGDQGWRHSRPRRAAAHPPDRDPVPHDRRRRRRRLGLQPAADPVPGGGHRPGERCGGGLGPRRPGAGDARQHGRARGVRPGGGQRPPLCRRHAGAQPAGGCRAPDLRGRGHRGAGEQPGAPAQQPDEAARAWRARR